MYDFVMGALSEDSDYVFCRAAGNSSQLIRSVIRESSGEFLPVLATEGNDIPLLEATVGVLYSDRE